MRNGAAGVVRVVAVFAAERDRNSLRRIFRGFRWRGEFVQSCGNLQLALERFQPDVVLTDSALNSGESWRDVLRTAQERDGAPPVIVSSRLADDRLWAEVLNLGGYDLLVTPFSAREVHAVVHGAYRSRDNAKTALVPRSTAAAGGG
jgi:DNA-binding response OmpR family regulator